MKELVLLKLGGSLITDKEKKESLRAGILERCCREIALALQEKEFLLVVGHGGGSFPHFPAKEYRTAEGLIHNNSLKGFALVQDAAARLNRIVVGELLGKEVNAVSIQPSAMFVADGGRIRSAFLGPLKLLLGKGLVPVVFGDAVVDARKGCSILSTEQIFSHLAVELGARRIVLAGKVDGVYSADPLKDSNAKFFPRINAENFAEIREALGGSHGVDVTGGMLHKVEELHGLARKFISSQIVSGEKEGNIRKALIGERVGTVIE